MLALGFTDSGFVGLRVMVLGVTGGPIWLILCLVAGFVQWVSVGYEVGHGGFGLQWIRVGCGVFLGGFVEWVVVAHGGGATHGLPWVALKCLVCGCGSIFGGRKYVLVICENTYVKTIAKQKKMIKNSIKLEFGFNN